MDIRFEDEKKKGRTPSTRIHLPNQEEEAAPEERAPRTRAGKRIFHAPGVRVENPQITTLGRFGLIVSSFLFAGMVLFTLTGYERISRAYADINALNTEIDSTKLRINELDVQIECAVTIQDAQKVAESYGMRYPEKSQYVKIGDPLPFSGGAPSESPEESPATTTEPTTTPEPDTGGEPNTTQDGGGQPPANG